ILNKKICMKCNARNATRATRCRKCGSSALRVKSKESKGA
ncbi:MAG TPA: 50S ribosomal protein L40e, partial [Methanosarcina sp.]|nr:50S ribosomal protein L40e [Methanosarcina sp.]